MADKTQREVYLELALRTIQTELLEVYEALDALRPWANWSCDGDQRKTLHDAIRANNSAIGVAATAQEQA